MIVDNIDKIKHLTKGLNHNSIIHIEYMQRKKDGLTSRSDNSILAEWYCDTEEKISNALKLGKILCDYNFGRLYINLSPKRKESITYNIAEKIIQDIKNKSWKPIPLLNHCIDSQIGTHKIWVVDIDDISQNRKVNDFIQAQRSAWDNPVIDILFTPNGFHLLTHPFDCSKFQFEGVSLFKNGSTLAYANIPKN